MRDRAPAFSAFQIIVRRSLQDLDVNLQGDDGVILVDGQIDPTTRNNRNDGTIWSDSSVLARNGSWSAANAAITFDGDLSTTPAWNANYDSAYFKPGWTDIKKIRIYFTEVGTGSAVFSINGTDYKANAAAVGNNAWWTAPSSITTIDSSTGTVSYTHLTLPTNREV